MVREKDFLLAVRVSSALKKAVDGAAEKSGLTSAEWIRATLAHNAGVFTPRKGDRHGKRKRRTSKD
jgi:hypothetical protein